MIKKIKLGMRMLRYCFGLKSNLIGMGIFFALGLLTCLLPGDRSLPSFFLMVVVIWPVQMIYSLSVSDMIGTSPRRKAMQTSIPALISAAVAVPVFLLVAVLAFSQRSEGTAKSAILVCALYAFAILIYAGVVYKFFIASTIGFCMFCLMMGRIQYLRLTSESLQAFFDTLPYGAAVGIGLLMILAGVLAEYAVSLLIYRFPLAKRAQMRGLQKTM